MNKTIKSKKNIIAISIGLLFALVLGFGLGVAYSQVNTHNQTKEFEEYSSYVIKEEERLQTTDDFTQLPQYYQDEQINKIPKSLTGKQEQLAYMLAYGLSNDYQDNWFNVN